MNREPPDYVTGFTGKSVTVRHTAGNSEMSLEGA